MRMKLKTNAGVVVWAVCLTVVPARGVVVGTTDTFQDGSSHDWDGGIDAYVPTGGPAGDGDQFVRVGSGSFSSVPNLAIFNEAARWQGDYTAAGATTLSADVKVLDGSALDLRAVLFGGNSGASRATSTTSVLVPADGQWHHVTFDITAAGLTVVFDFDGISNLLASVNRIMLRHQGGPPASGGTAVSAWVGFDNIAVTPEPAALLLCVFGCLTTVLRRPGTQTTA